MAKAAALSAERDAQRRRDQEAVDQLPGTKEEEPAVYRQRLETS